MLKLYEFNWDCGRQGELNGLFIADETDVGYVLGKEVYFGEVLGKHSEIYGPLEPDDLEVKSDDQDFIRKLYELFERKTLSGFNPIEQWLSRNEEIYDDIGRYNTLNIKISDLTENKLSDIMEK